MTYAEKVAHYLEGLNVSTGACTGCAECGLEDCDDMNTPEYESAGEPNFSWSQCDGCGSTLGGDRHPAHGLTNTGDIIHLDVCVDCVFYITYGDLPEGEA